MMAKLVSNTSSDSKHNPKELVYTSVFLNSDISFGMVPVVAEQKHDRGGPGVRDYEAANYPREVSACEG